MANYPTVNSKARGARHRKGTLGVHIPSPTHTYTHENMHVVTTWHSLADQETWQGPVCTPGCGWSQGQEGCGQLMCALLVCSLAGIPLALFLGRAPSSSPMFSSHLPVAFLSRKGRTQSRATPAVQTSAWPWRVHTWSRWWACIKVCLLFRQNWLMIWTWTMLPEASNMWIRRTTR